MVDKQAKTSLSSEPTSFKDNHLANMAWWLKSEGALNFEL